ncbi:MAG: hypothetical protein ABI672_09545 [Vicinamibacteria bacterium]
MIWRTRWRRTLVAACLPYVLLAVFADFLHVHSAWTRMVASNTNQGPSLSDKVEGARQPGAPCPLCLFLRDAPRLTSLLSVEAARVTTIPKIWLPPADAPASPIPHPTAFRGPPTLALA